MTVKELLIKGYTDNYIRYNLFKQSGAHPIDYRDYAEKCFSYENGLRKNKVSKKEIEKIKQDIKQKYGFE